MLLYTFYSGWNLVLEKVSHLHKVYATKEEIEDVYIPKSVQFGSKLGQEVLKIVFLLVCQFSTDCFNTDMATM